jgi:hypothetical protein
MVEDMWFTKSKLTTDQKERLRLIQSITVSEVENAIEKYEDSLPLALMAPLFYFIRSSWGFLSGGSCR